VTDIRCDQAEFSVDPSSAIVYAGGSLIFDIIFNPKSAGDRSSRVTITSNAAQVYLDYIGSAVSGPNIQVALESEYIGACVVESCLDCRFTISNVGDEALEIRSITCEGAAYSVADTSFTLAAGQGVPVVFGFTPVSSGYNYGSIRISSSDGDQGSLVLNLSGMGQASTSDLNGNGRTDIMDLIEIIKILGNPVPGSLYGDCNGDGKVNIFDFIDLLRTLGQG